MRFRFVLGLAAVTAIAIGSVAGALLVRSHENSAFERRQEDAATRAAHQAEASAALSIGQLASAVAFYQGVDRLTAHKFRLMAESMLDSGTLVGTGLLQVVPHAARADFERRTGHPIADRARIGLERAERRPVYYPLAYAASTTSLEPPLGFDVGADPLRGPYVRRARDAGEPAATRVMHLAIGGTGINVFRPVYRDGASVQTVAQRRRALTGIAVGSFDVHELAQAAATPLEDDVDLQLIEGSRTVIGPELPRGDSAAAQVRIADRSWLLVVRDPARPSIALPLLIAVFGVSMALLLGALILVWSRSERMRELQQQASQDSVTGLKNRRRFEEDLRIELARSRRDGSEGALLIVDIDRFKPINDTLGHPTGDRVIREVADVLRGRMRETDIVARLGGDEFAAALPRCGLEEATAVAEGIATGIRDGVQPLQGLPPVTVSIGIAMFGDASGRDLERLEDAADAAMYRAKQAGRDAIRVSGSSGVPQPQDTPG
jgi:diguanylate cyclase (GGDEF)-like protein